MNSIQPILASLVLGFLLGSCSNATSAGDDIISAQIHFELPEDSHVELWLENNYHTRVKTLVDEQLNQGSHSVQLVMTDENGSPLPEGVYKYTLKAEELGLNQSRFIYHLY